MRRAAIIPLFADPKGFDYYEKHIRPVLVERCYKCHSAAA